LPVFTQLEIPILIGPPIPYPNFNKEPYVFSPNLHQVTLQKEDFKDYMAALGIKNPVLITNDDASGVAISGIWDADGYATEIVPLDVTNYEPVLSKLRDAGHDALVTIGSGGQPPAFVSRAKKALGWDVPQFLAPSNLVEDYLNLAGDAAEGVRGFLWPAGAGSGYFAEGSEQRKAVEMLEAAVPDVELSLHANIGYYWDHALAIALAIESSGSTDPKVIRDTLETLEFWGANGFNKRTPEDHVGYQRESALRAVVMNGQIVPDEG
jgi:branched-chain amino acid transport system substrate-binding protein